MNTKRFFSASILIFAFCVALFAQGTCPTISVIGPSGTVMTGETMIFEAKVSDSIDKIIYRWTVNNGTIIEGKDTRILKVQTTRNMSGQIITATVEIAGLPKECPNTAYEVGVIASLPNIDTKIADYEKISFREEKTKLDMLVSELQYFKGQMAVFLIYITKKDSISALKTRITNISNYLTKVHKIPKDKFNFIFEESGFYRTKIYILPIEDNKDFLSWEESIKKLELQKQTLKKTKPYKSTK